MIQLFEIKKKIKKEDNELLNKYSEISKKTNEEVLKEKFLNIGIRYDRGRVTQQNT